MIESSTIARTSGIRQVVHSLGVHVDRLQGHDATAADLVRWIPGRDRESGAVLWFRSDGVEYHVMHDTDGKPIGVGYQTTDRDVERRDDWARARDRRGDFEYESVSAADVRDLGNKLNEVDRSKSIRVHADWHHAGGEPVYVAVHAAPRFYAINVRVGLDSDGQPIARQFRIDGSGLGNLLAANPDFLALLEQRRGDVVFGQVCRPAGYRADAAELAADALHRNGVDRTVYAATGTVYAHNYGPDGHRIWARDAPISTLAVTEGRDSFGNPEPGRYVAFRPPPRLAEEHN